MSRQGSNRPPLNHAPSPNRGGERTHGSILRGRGGPSIEALDSYRAPPSVAQGSLRGPMVPGPPHDQREMETPSQYASFFEESSNVEVTGATFLNTSRDYVSRDINITVHNHPGRGAAESDEENSTHLAASSQIAESRSTLPSSATGSHIPGRVWTTEISLPVRKSCDVYYRHLAVKGRGSPLWIPDPNNNLPMEYRRTGVRIGDVGILTSSGSFDFLFNICEPANHPINRGGVPDGFSPVQDIREDDIRRHPEFKPGSYLSSTSLKTVHYNDDGDLSTRGLTFEASAAEGAILTMPSGACSTDLAGVLDYEESAADQLENWYKFVIGIRRRKVRNGDIRLIIGCDKSTSWGMATFVNSSKTGSFHLTFKPKADSSLGRVYDWECSGMAEAKTGPSPDEVLQLHEGQDNPSPSYDNQCLFIRTLNPTFEEETWQKLSSSIRVGRLHKASRKTFKSASRAAGLNQTSNASSSMSPAVNISTSEATTMTSHPSNDINNLLLETCKNLFRPKMIITTDTNWTSVLCNEDSDLPSAQELVSRILDNHTPLMKTHNKILVLQACSKLPSRSDSVSRLAQIIPGVDDAENPELFPNHNNNADSNDEFLTDEDDNLSLDSTYNTTDNGVNEITDNPAAYYSGVSLCIVCQQRPGYSNRGKSYPTCGLTCAAVLNNGFNSTPSVSNSSPSSGLSSRTTSSYGARGATSSNSLNQATHSSLSFANATIDRRTEHLDGRMPRRHHPHASPSTKPKSTGTRVIDDRPQAHPAPIVKCIVCLIRPCRDSKYVTCGLTCAEKLCAGRTNPNNCDYCLRYLKAPGSNQCSMACSENAKLACLLCKSRPMLKRYHLCGKTCRQIATKLAPLILEAQPGHAAYEMVENMFKGAWKYPGTRCPPINKIYKIIENEGVLQSYDRYKKSVGNEVFRYHGTTRKCALGSPGNTKLCSNNTCTLCSILKSSFKTSLATMSRAFGPGIYSSSSSNKAYSYTSGGSGAVLLTKVILGKVRQVSGWNEVMSCPPGHNSVIFDRQNGSLNETIVYSDDAIRPVFLIIF